MKIFERPYFPGSAQGRNLPLGRYLPPVPAGMVSGWLRQEVPPGAWLLDPFGSNPALTLEAARAGYRVLVTVNNPVLVFLLETLAAAPKASEFQAALAELGSTRRGDERLEVHLQSLYETPCPGCGRLIQAQAFLWRKDENASYARLVACPHCGANGEHQVTPLDLERLGRIGASGLHRARAIERVAPPDDEGRAVVEEALHSYLPRPLYVLFTLLNRIEGLPGTSQRRKELLSALLLGLFDDGSSLWPVTGRARPRQLTIPPAFKENNLWLALENAISAWSEEPAPVPLARWPALPPETGGICLYPGRLRALLPLPDTIKPAAAIAALPRPNQAFWTLSALWAGWLWGREAVQPVKVAFERRRYDWHWHAGALFSVFAALNGQFAPGFPFFALLPEPVPGFLTAALAASQAAGLELDNLALRGDNEPAQALWKASRARSPRPFKNAETLLHEGIGEHLAERGEPDAYLPLFAAGLVHFARHGGIPLRQPEPNDKIIDAIAPAMAKVLTGGPFVTRYNGSPQNLEIGQWWLAYPRLVAAPLSERVEEAVLRVLVEHGPCSPASLEAALCGAFPGLLTPTAGMIRAVLESYGEPAPGMPGMWRLRASETPAALDDAARSTQEALHRLASRLGFQSSGSDPLLWRDTAGKEAYAFYIITRGQLCATLLNPSPVAAERCVLVYPSARVALLQDRLQHDPRLLEAAASGWKLLKIETLRGIAEAEELTEEKWEELLASEGKAATQMQMFYKL